MVRLPALFQRVIVSILSMVFLSTAASAESSLSLDVSPRAGTIDDQYTLSVTIKSPDNARPPELEENADFTARYIGPEQRMQFDMTRGETEHQITHHFQLKPRRMGTLHTPAVRIQTASGLHTLDPLSVTVGKSALPAPAADKDVFLRQSISTDRPYLGQQVGNRLEIFLGTDVLDDQLVENNFTHFWVEEPDPQEKSFRLLYNRRFAVVTKRTALFPLKTGEIELPQPVLVGKIRERSRRSQRFPSPFLDFEDFFGTSKLVSIRAQANPLSISVRPLPARPKNFPDWGSINTLVGHTTIDAQYSTQSLTVGESRELKLRLKSTGNLRPFDKPPLVDTTHYRVYLNDSKIESALSGTQYEFTRTYSLSIVPLQSGSISIPPLKIGYFDPADGAYKVAVSREIEFPVEAGATPFTQAPEHSQLTDEDTRQNPQTLSYTARGPIETFFRTVSPWFILYVLVAFAVFAGLVFLSQKIFWTELPVQKAARNLRSAYDIQSLSMQFRALLAARFGLPSSASFRRFRHSAKTQLENSDLQTAVVLCLDDLERAEQQPPGEAMIRHLRSRMIELSEQL